MSDGLMMWLEEFLWQTVVLMNSVVFPGTYFTIWDLTLTTGVCVVLISVVRRIVGLKTDDWVITSGGNNSNIKISEERKNDEK